LAADAGWPTESSTCRSLAPKARDILNAAQKAFAHGQATFEIHANASMFSSIGAVDGGLLRDVDDWKLFK